VRPTRHQLLTPLGIVLLCSALAAQTGTGSARAPSATGGASPATPGARSEVPVLPFDRVLAIVGEWPITLSSIREQLELVCRTKLGELRRADPNAKLSPRQIEKLMWELVQKKAWSYLEASRFQSLPVPIDRLESYVDRELDGEEKRQTVASGSSAKFLENLRAKGMTRKDWRESERLKIMARLVVQDERFRILADLPHKITPREMLQFYRKHAKELVRKASARVQTWTFAAKPDGNAGTNGGNGSGTDGSGTDGSGTDGSGTDGNGHGTGSSPLERAEQARKQLLAKVAPEEVMARFDGQVETKLLTPDSDDADFLRNFAFDSKNAIGTVSEPKKLGDIVILLQLESRTDGGLPPFNDAKTQDFIRRQIASERYQRWHRQLQRKRPSRNILPRDLFLR